MQSIGLGLQVLTYFFQGNKKKIKKMFMKRNCLYKEFVGKPEKNKSGHFYVLLVLCLVRYFMITALPIYVRDAMGADEYLMLYQAEQLLQGNYLGPYDQFTLVKGPFFPMFLACCNWLGISYLSGTAMMYILGCFVVTKAIQHFVPNSIINLLIFAVILFAPSMGSSYLQLVYRDAITPALILNLLGAFMLVYIHREEWKPFLLWMIYASFFWIALWFTREDSIWSVPLVGILIIVLILSSVLDKQRIHRLELTLRIVSCFIPIVLLFGSIHLLSAVNYHYYGIYTTNELNDSKYTEAVMLLTKIKPDEEQDYVTISHSAICKAYEVSPTFSNLKNVIEQEYKSSSLLKAGREPENGEFNEDLITWALRGAAAAMGYYTSAQTAEAFWGVVARELQQAIDAGNLEARPIMPSRSMIPWPFKPDSFSILLNAVREVYQSLCNYDVMYVYNSHASPDVSGVIKRYEGLTRNAAIAPISYEVLLSGWFFLTEPTENICTINLYDAKNNLLATAECRQSEDVYSGYLSNIGMDYPNAKAARYSIHVETDETELYGEFVNEQGEQILRSPLDQLSMITNTDTYCLAVDRYSIQPLRETSYFNNPTQRAETVLDMYRVANPLLSICAMLLYLGWTVWVIVEALKKKPVAIDAWLCISACAGSMIVYLLGLSYVHAFMVEVRSGYLAGLAVLHQLFVVFVDGYALAYLSSYRKRKQKYTTQI